MLSLGSGLERDGGLGASNLGGAGLADIPGGASFTTPPISFFDTEKEIVVAFAGGGADSIWRFRGSTASPNTTQGLLQTSNAVASFESAANQPQWHEDVGDPGVPDAANYSIAWISDTGDALDTNPLGSPPVSGAYFGLNVFNRDWTMFGVPTENNGTKENISVFRIAETANLSNVLAEVTLTLRYIRGTG